MLPFISHGSAGVEQLGCKADRFTRAGQGEPGLFRQVDGGLLEPGVRRAVPHFTAPRRGRPRSRRRFKGTSILEPFLTPRKRSRPGRSRDGNSLLSRHEVRC